MIVVDFIAGGALASLAALVVAVVLLATCSAVYASARGVVVVARILRTRPMRLPKATARRRRR